MVTNDIPAILARADAAPSAPWELSDGGDFGERQIHAASGYYVGEATDEAGAIFIAHSRTDVPNMAAEILSLRAQLADYGKAVKEIHTIARYVGIPGEAATRLQGVLKMIGRTELSRREKENG